MCRIRAFEESALEALAAGDVPGPLHPSIGQEAVAVGVCSNLRRDDIVLSTHRGHGHTLVKGASPEAMMRELLGRAGGCCRGKGGSMHIADFSVGMLGANGVVGANILIATGAAHAITLRGEGRVVVCIFGDGAMNRGPFMEGLNWAQVYRLPVIFVCEDNQYAATTRTATVSAGPGPAARAESLGVAATTVDGNDVLALDDTMRDLVGAVRGGAGPHLVHARTYRLTGHTGADKGLYRSAEEVEERRLDDPIARCAGWLLDAGVEHHVLDDVAARAQREMAAVLEAARNAPWPDPAHAFEDVQDLRGPGFPAIV
ncbi:MAG: thiamine pyrophosphate-dependent dehydrogenase E1 component subunit alpha [Ectothiorhodospiraceae bacterium]|nr:thiamine pyrophosphate-dependent dehydrogenase E1 component subunit alpha [Chromatiales bacterium]MCP5156341.1 thiamine pyrophosphate-dependent dehydrogenase E1 component subunit alpha [Ectothiorhodospiraceae bacterium]